MMKKQHGPAFRKDLKLLDKCPDCQGRGFTNGVFHQIDCGACHSSGLVEAGTAKPLDLQDLVGQLSLRLQLAQREIEALKRQVPMIGPAAQYNQNNRRGPGATNFTGD
jgi:hypothetical protein